MKSKKCTAETGAAKRYRRLDGTLIEKSEESHNNVIMDTMILNEDHQVDCNENDLIPFNNDIQDDSNLEIFHECRESDDEEYGVI